MMPGAPELYEDQQRLREERAIRRSRIWWLVAVLFTLVNVGGAAIAAINGEVLHADVHGALAFVGAYFVWRFSTRRVARY